MTELDSTTRWHLATLTMLLFASGCVATTASDDEIAAENDVGLEADAPDVAVQAEALRFGAGYGFAWVQPSDDGKSPAVSWSYNSSGGAISVERLTAGGYSVNFNGLQNTQARDVAHVVAYGSDEVRCSLNEWIKVQGASAEKVRVDCFKPNGTRADSAFVVQYQHAATSGAQGVGGFAWVEHLDGSGSISVITSWNSTGGQNSATRVDKGAYDVTMPGLGAFGGSVQLSMITPFNFLPLCTVSGFAGVGGVQHVFVNCFKNGVAYDLADLEGFTVTYASTNEVSNFDEGAYAWADKATTSSYTPDPNFSFNSGNSLCSGRGTNTASRSNTGLYTMRHSLLSNIHSAVHVTAYGSSPRYCKVRGWSASGTGTAVSIGCFNSNGGAADTRYLETYSMSSSRPPC